MNILLGVTGGIAAYKSCEFCSLSVKSGHQIQVLQTTNAAKFVGGITFEGLTGRPVLKILLNLPWITLNGQSGQTLSSSPRCLQTVWP